MGSGDQTARQQARHQVGEAHALRVREWAEREKDLGKAAVEVVAALVARDRAEQRAAVAVRSMMVLGVHVAEVAQRCGISQQAVTRLKHMHPEGLLDARLPDPKADAGPDREGRS
jgi:hypothetical protein